MNIKELIIGSIVQNSLGIIYTVDGIEQGELGVLVKDVFGDRLCVDLEFLKPVPLTEDWLVRSRLVKKFQETPFEDGGFVLNKDGSRWYNWVQGSFNLEIQPEGDIYFEVYSHYIHVEWVHQLQNLVFALTGEELSLLS